MKRITHPDDLDTAIAESAEAEARAQLAIILAVKPLGQQGRVLIFKAVSLILEADGIVLGIFDALLRGLKSEGKRGSQGEKPQVSPRANTGKKAGTP